MASLEDMNYGWDLEQEQCSYSLISKSWRRCKDGDLHLEVDPVHAVPDVLEHALKGHEEVAVFEARLTAAGTGRSTHALDTHTHVLAVLEASVVM